MSKYLLVIFWFFLILFNHPISAIFDRQELFLNIPVFVIYIFVTWALMVLSLVYLFQFKGSSKS